MKFQIFVDIIFESDKNITSANSDDIKKWFQHLLVLRGENEDFEIQLNFLSNAIELVGRTRTHLTLCEISEGEPCVMFNSGYLAAKKNTLIYFYRGKLGYQPHPLIQNPSKVEDVFSALVRDKEFSRKVKSELFQKFNFYYRFEFHFEKIWFNTNSTEPINIVVVPDDIPTVDNLNDDIYNYGDKDTFIETCIFLSKYVPDSRLIRKLSNDRDIIRIKSEDLVVIGGPGSPEDEGNLLCKEFMEVKRSKIKYKNDPRMGYYMLVNNKSYYAKPDLKGEKLEKDFGYFACFSNPFDRRRRVILINGIHTLGVLGAFLAFSDNKKTENNYKTILNKVKNNDEEKEKLLAEETLEFECFFEVELRKNEILIPTIEADNIFFFNNNNSTINVFISYSHFDSEFARRLKQRLEDKRNLVSYYADENLKNGQNIPKEIQEKIRASDYFILVVSRYSVNSHWVHDEISSFNSTGKPILPICLDRVSFPEPYYHYIAPLKYIDFSDSSKFEANVEHLINTMAE